MNQQKIGFVIVIISVVALVLLLGLKLRTDKQMLSACENSCDNKGGSCNLASCPYHQTKDFSWIITSIGILVAFLGGTGLYLALPQKMERVIEEKEYDVSSLSDEEKKVFFFIKDRKEGVYQSSIVKEFSLSKVQVTRLLDKLEGQDLIERKRRGLSNLIVVK